MITNYKDLTLKQYLALREIDTTQEDLEIQVQMIAVLTDRDEDEILDLPIAEYQRLVQGLSFLSEPPKGESKPPREIKIDGEPFVVLRNAEGMTTGQFIDYQNYIKDPEEAERNLPLILSCFVIPKGKKYGDYDIDAVVEKMKKIPITTVLTISGFFFRKSQQLLNATLTFLEWKIRRMARKEKDKEVKRQMEEAMKGLRILKDSARSGGGLTA